MTVEQIYNTTVRKLWQALTDKDQMKIWYFDLKEFKPEKGFKFQFSGGDENVQYLHECEILEVSPPHKLSCSWRYPDYEGYSVVTFELTEEAPDKTRLKLTHEGLESFPKDDPNFAVESFTQGWNFILGDSLKNYIETAVIKKSVSLQASAEKIWEVLLHPNGQWGKAFGGGAEVKASWEPGTAITWYDEEGNVGARGIIKTHEPQQLLQADMYDDPDPQPGSQPGEYSEKYRLVKVGEDDYELHLEAGPLARKYVEEHAGMWDETLRIIKEVVEKR
ncbi:SRPBCC domain-containing protein [Chitinophaga sedimenti]|uniref:SRPBCC family protein n=1 Tax=Chitinophaga sedimenti TaxID=2033606 RepID=UPI002002B84E|nr:SRPBCC domain-containing protein [Chitinophaga sedimenti]MCK7557962.1 SRPBCC domain-containing protein [Chitinophaga sedimenti]